MATWTKCVGLTFLLGCGAPDIDLLLVKGNNSDPESFVCDDGVSIVVGNANNTALCLGLSCGSADLSTYDCNNPASNAAAGTCVEAFFARCPISGTCMELPNFSGHQWSNGARSDSGNERYAPGSDTPCAQYEQTGYGSPVEETWFAEGTTTE